MVQQHEPFTHVIDDGLEFVALLPELHALIGDLPMLLLNARKQRHELVVSLASQWMIEIEGVQRLDERTRKLTRHKPGQKRNAEDEQNRWHGEHPGYATD